MLQLLSYLTLLTLVSRQVTEEVLGAYLGGLKMKVAAVIVAIGLAFGLRELAANLSGDSQLPIPMYDVYPTLVFGILAGLGANVWHLVLDKFTGGASSNDITLTSPLKAADPAPKPPASP